VELPSGKGAPQPRLPGDSPPARAAGIALLKVVILYVTKQECNHRASIPSERRGLSWPPAGLSGQAQACLGRPACAAPAAGRQQAGSRQPDSPRDVGENAASVATERNR